MSPGGTEAVVTVVDNSLYVELEEVSISHKKPVGENLKSGAVVPTTNPPYQSILPATSQMGFVHGQKLPQAVVPTPNPRGFAHVSSSGVAQRPVIGSIQPPSPPQAAPAPAAPPPTVQTADTFQMCLVKLFSQLENFHLF
ncbi:hypothetical protein K1719_006886 [Acacia pycnantha]|nr:hypothetical protein K1719_006886 [Acacia pycnantha]